jgi:hypothetical protein
MIEALWIAAAMVLPGPQQEVSFWTPPPKDRQVSGRVVTVQGAPVAGAALSLRAVVPYASEEVASGVSGSDGRFVLLVWPFEDGDNYLGRSYLWVEAPGFAPSRIDRVPLPSPPLDVGDVFVFEPVELSGVVVDSRGRPVAGAQIHAALGRAGGAYEDHARRPPIATSDAHGAFICRSLPPGVVTLGASAPGFADAVLEPLRLGESSNSVRFELAEGRRTELVVVDDNELPVQGARALPMGDLRRSWQLPTAMTPLDFWRGAQAADAQGRIRFDGLSASFDPDVEIQAQGYQPSWIRLAGPNQRVVLRRATMVHISAVRDSDGSPVAIHSVDLRNGRTPDFLFCGWGEERNWLCSWSDSAAVRVLEPSHWEIEWNGAHGRVRGGQPGKVMVIAEDGTRVRADLPLGLPAGHAVEYEARLAQPSTLSGRVVDSSGKPVALTLGSQIDFHRLSFVTTRSAANGAFRFDRLDGRFVWLYSKDEAWTIDEGTATWRVEAGSTLSGIEVRVWPRAHADSGLAKVRLIIGGRGLEVPVLVALHDMQSELCDEIPRAFAWTDAEGRLEIDLAQPGDYFLVPQRSVGAESGAWRDFLAGFPAHGKNWPGIVTIPETGVREQSIDLPAESEWARAVPANH